MPRWTKAFLGLLLIPICICFTRALVRVIQHTGSASSFWIAFIAGFGAWILLFLRLPKPLWVYVVGHELTHAAWTWLFGGRVKALHITSRGGHVRVTKSNFLTVLAPYFFPFYAVLWALAFGMANWIFHWNAYLFWFHLGLGIAYGFHATLTLYILRTRQTDIESEGWIFSMAIIWIGNTLIPLVSLPILTGRLSAISGFTFILEAFRWFMDVFSRVWNR